MTSAKETGSEEPRPTHAITRDSEPKPRGNCIFATAPLPARPSSDPTLIGVWALRSDAQAPAEARRLARKALAPLCTDQTVIDDAVLMVSELTTNAVLHGRPPYELVVRHCGRDVLVDVVDGGFRAAPCRDAPADEEHGRGLSIVTHLSAGRCGWLPVTYLTRPEVHGKAAWFAIPATPVSEASC
jgi:anti-sigma regulatory factor (Ser/Thr protein kinase)